MIRSLLLASLAVAAPLAAQEDPVDVEVLLESWSGFGGSVDNNDATTGNGPTLGTGFDLDGKYWTFTYDNQQLRIHSKDASDNWEDALEALEGKHIEFDINSGKLQDIHEDV